MLLYGRASFDLPSLSRVLRQQARNFPRARPARIIRGTGAASFSHTLSPPLPASPHPSVPSSFLSFRDPFPLSVLADDVRHVRLSTRLNLHLAEVARRCYPSLMHTRRLFGGDPIRALRDHPGSSLLPSCARAENRRVNQLRSRSRDPAGLIVT
jgi:hypothetical protein